jgi:hypothetical protein
MGDCASGSKCLLLHPYIYTVPAIILFALHPHAMTIASTASKPLPPRPDWVFQTRFWTRRPDPSPLKASISPSTSSKPLDHSAEAEADSTKVECEICCTVNVPLDNVTFCSGGHAFCKDCARRMAEVQIGMRKSALPCMSMKVSSGCVLCARRFVLMT